jgi:hypothetical protein
MTAGQISVSACLIVKPHWQAPADPPKRDRDDSGSREKLTCGKSFDTNKIIA